MALDRREFLRSFAAVGGALALAATPALADDARSTRTLDGQAEAVAYESPIEQAGLYGQEDLDNIGITVFYGVNNGVTKEQVGEFVERKLLEQAAQRGMNIDPRYFVIDADFEGVGVGYHMGGLAVDAQDIREAVSEETLNEVLDTRQNTARLLAAQFSTNGPAEEL